MIKMDNVEGISTSTAIVVRNIYLTEADANEAFLASTGVKLVSKSVVRKNVNADAYYSGKEYGNTVGLNTQVTGGTVVSGNLPKA